MTLLRRPLPRGRGILRCGPRPRDPRQRLGRRGAGAERARRAPQRLVPPPSAAGRVPVRLRASIFLPSPPHSELLNRLRAAAHRRVTPRPPRDPPIVSSQQLRRRGRAKPCLPPALRRTSRVRAPRGGAQASWAALPRRVPERSDIARFPAARSPGVALEQRLRLPISPLPAGSPGIPFSRRYLPPAGLAERLPQTLHPGRRRAKGPARSPPAAPASPPLDSWVASARTSLRGTWLGASCTLGIGGREAGRMGGTARPWPLDLPEDGTGEQGGCSWAEGESRGCGGTEAALLLRHRRT